MAVVCWGISSGVTDECGSAPRVTWKHQLKTAARGGSGGGGDPGAGGEPPGPGPSLVNETQGNLIKEVTFELLPPDSFIHC